MEAFIGIRLIVRARDEVLNEFNMFPFHDL